MRAIPNVAVDFVGQWEGCELTAYQDIVGVWTVGYGSTGTYVFKGLKITKAQARELLRDDLKIAAARVIKRVGAAVVDELTENQWAAILSFTFNLGSGNPNKPEWTIWKRLRAKQFDQVPLEFMKFVNAGGKKVQGLVNRRAAEVKLWATDEPGSSEEVLPSSVTREIATPPTPADPTPPGKSATVITLATSAVAGVPVAAKTTMDAIQPYAEYAPIVHQALGGLAVVAACAVVLGLVLAWLSKRKQRG